MFTKCCSSDASGAGHWAVRLALIDDRASLIGPRDFSSRTFTSLRCVLTAFMAGTIGWPRPSIRFSTLLRRFADRYTSERHRDACVVSFLLSKRRIANPVSGRYNACYLLPHGRRTITNNVHQHARAFERVYQMPPGNFLRVLFDPLCLRIGAYGSATKQPFWNIFIAPIGLGDHHGVALRFRCTDLSIQLPAHDDCGLMFFRKSSETMHVLLVKRPTRRAPRPRRNRLGLRLNSRSLVMRVFGSQSYSLRRWK